MSLERQKAWGGVDSGEAADGEAPWRLGLSKGRLIVLTAPQLCPQSAWCLGPGA